MFVKFDLIGGHGIFFAKSTEIFGVVVVIADRDGQRLFGFLLLDHEAVEVSLDFARQKIEIEDFARGLRFASQIVSIAPAVFLGKRIETIGHRFKRNGLSEIGFQKIAQFLGEFIGIWETFFIIIIIAAVFFVRHNCCPCRCCCWLSVWIVNLDTFRPQMINFRDSRSPNFTKFRPPSSNSRPAHGVEANVAATRERVADQPQQDLFNRRLYPLQSPTVPSSIADCTLFNRRLYPLQSLTVPSSIADPNSSGVIEYSRPSVV